jgi:branched-chain amino acid transport system ATP-binding protein
VLLEVAHLSVRYEKAVLINDLNLSVDTGELVSLVGPNGAGKSTTLRTITGLVAWERELKRRSTAGDIFLEGAVTFNGERIDQVPAHEIVRRGLVLCPERRRPFREMSVLDNLLAGAYLQKDKKKILEGLEKIYAMFPVLKTRSGQISGTLSGGEQQMLAIGRGLMSTPQLLMLDEPSLGLAPIMVLKVLDVLQKLNQEGLTLMLVEQNVHSALNLSGRGYVIENGRIVIEGSGQELLNNAHVKEAYLGIV